MTEPSLTLIKALRMTAGKLQTGGEYQWGHMGSCNCGLLAQELTPFSKAEIHQIAMEKCGDWTEQLNDYCPVSGFRMDSLIDLLLAEGLSHQDLINLENLSDMRIVVKLNRYLTKNCRQDLIIYLETWADLLEEDLLAKIAISDLNSAELIT